MRTRSGALRISGLVWVACAAVLWAFVGTGWATVWNVSTVSQLQGAVSSAGPGDEIIIVPGTYNLTSPLNLSDVGMTIRGSTGDREDVELVGGGMNTRGVDEILIVNVDDVTIRDLTARDCYFNGIHIRGENQASGTLISNVKIIDIGERHIKGSGGGSASAISDDVVIEQVYMLQTQPRTGHPDTNPDYIGGIDCMGTRGWTIRDSVAEGIVGAENGGNAGIFLWQGVQNVTIERNAMISCAKGIALGNPSGPTASPPVFTYPWHAINVMVRNNFVLRGPWTTGNNIGIELCNTKDVSVYNNTFYSENASYFRLISPYDAAGEGLTTNLQMVNNIIRGGVFDLTQAGGWSAASVAAMGNLVHGEATIDVSPTWFVDPANGDFHLTALATPAIDQATVLADVPEDIDRQTRPSGSAPDFGGDEYVVLPALVSSDPAADGTLPKTQNNVMLLTFDSAISLPGSGPALSIFGGGFEEGDAFTYSVEPDGVTLKAVEQGPILTDLTWYQIAPTAAFQVDAFAFDLCTLVGDANNSGRVTTADYSQVKAHMSEYTDARYDLNGSGRVTTADYSVVKANLGHRVPPKP